MSVYAIEAVHINTENDRIEQVRWGRIDPARHFWETEPVVTDLDDVVARIKSGDEVWTAFMVGHLSVLGPKVQLSVDEQGSEGITTVAADDHPGRTLIDLPFF